MTQALGFRRLVRKNTPVQSLLTTIKTYWELILLLETTSKAYWELILSLETASKAYIADLV